MPTEAHGKKILFRQIRGPVESVDAAAAFFGQNLKPLLKAVLFIAMPFIILTLLANILLAAMFAQVRTIGTASSFYVGLAMMLGLSAIAFSLLIAVVYEYMMLYRQSPGPEAITIAEIRRNIFKNAGGYLTTTLFLGFFWAAMAALMAASMLSMNIMVLISYILFIYFGITLSFIYIVRVAERTSLANGVLRTFELQTGNWWKSFGMLLLTAIISVCIILFPTYASSLLSYLFFSINPALSDILMLLGGIFYLLIAFVSQLLGLIAIAFRYFSLVEAREGAGLMEKVAVFGEKGDPSPISAREGEA